MRLSRALPLLTVLLIAPACGWSPSNSGQSNPAECEASDTPTVETIKTAVQSLDGTWQEQSRGHTGNCRLHWVVVGTAEKDPDAGVQVLFFDRNSPLGTATPQPRPYTTVVPMGDATATVQYQWRQGSDQPCCPTGIGQVRFQVGEDGKLAALDPVPEP